MLAQRKRSQGFSLMELMIVVVITGVLAAIAIPTFISYVQKSRTSEATQFLGVIKLKQEARRAEFGGYLVCNGNATMTEFEFVPDESKMKGGAQLNIAHQCFTDLGAKPDGAVRFGYAWIAGPPSPFPGDVATALGLVAADFDHYFVAHAITDLDSDDDPVIFELSNFTRNIYIMDKNGDPLAAGWE